MCSPEPPNAAVDAQPNHAAWRRYLVGGSYWAIVQTTVTMLTTLVSVPVSLAYLGTARYGLWMVVNSTLAFITFMDLGLMPTLKNRLAEAYSTNDASAARRYESCTLLVGLTLFLVGLPLIGVAWCIDWPSVLAVTDPWARADAMPLVLVTAGVNVTLLALSAVDSIYSARLAITALNVWATAASVASLGLLLLGVRMQVSLATLAAITSGVRLVYRPILLAHLIRADRSFVGVRFGNLMPMLKEVLPVSVLFSGIQVCYAAMLALPNLVIARCLTLNDVAAFNVAGRVAGLPLNLVTAVLPVFWPAFTVAWANGELGWLRRHIALLAGGTTTCLALYALALVPFGGLAVRILSGGEVRVPVALLVTLGLYGAIQGAVHWLSTFLHSISDFGFELGCYAASTLALAALGTWLTLAQGNTGMAMAMGLSLVVGSLVPMCWRATSMLRE